MFAYVKALVAGVVSMLAFHEGALWALDALGYVSAMPWHTEPATFFDVPGLVWLGAWGALWGLVLWALIRNAQAAGYYVGALILGAILVTLADLFGVPLLKGHGTDGMMAGLALDHIVTAMILNGVFGLGLALIMRLLHPPR